MLRVIVRLLFCSLLSVAVWGRSNGQHPGAPGSAFPSPLTDAEPGSKCSYTGEHRATVKLLVTGEGLPTEVAIATSSGVACVDELAVQAVKQYHFPAKGMPIRLQIEVNFSEKGSGPKG